jgi:hypothetical protein
MLAIYFLGVLCCFLKIIYQASGRYDVCVASYITAAFLWPFVAYYILFLKSNNINVT